MIVRYETREQKRAARLQLYKDDVFVIAHEATKEYETNLSIEELFASAERLAHYLIENEITDKDSVDFEVDDLEETIGNEGDTAFLVISLAYVKLCALRKQESLAKDVARALVHRCQEYKDFSDLLHNLDNKEYAKHLDGWRADLINYELKTIKKDGCNLQQARDIIKVIVDNAEHYSTSSIEHLLNPLRDTNDQYCHAFDDEINRLKGMLCIKTTTSLNAEEVVLHKTVECQAIVNAGGVGFRNESK